MPNIPSLKQKTSAGGIILNPKGEIILVSQKGGSWSFPKGKHHLGETLLETAKREIREECGVVVSHHIKELGTYTRYRETYKKGIHIQIYKTITLFLFHAPDQALEPLDPDHPEARWVPKDQVADFLSHSQDKAFFERIQPDLDPFR